MTYNELEQAIEWLKRLSAKNADYLEYMAETAGQNDTEVLHIDAILNAVATGQLVPSQTWQPIETAPKDGTPILTLSSGCTDQESCMVMWWTPEKAERCGFGWEAYEVHHMLAPEFWMPLPAAPAPEVAE